MTRKKQVRTYDPASSVVYLKTNEQFGGLSNMAPGFPLKVNSIDILTSEALYQACRFPHRSDLQSLIIEQKSPMTAKMKTKQYRNLTRPDWDRVRIQIMRWCLRIKLAQNWLKFSRLLIETGERPIVEQSYKDDFWGAVPSKHEETLVGRNALGRLLMELREATTNSRVSDDFLIVEPINIPDFKLDNRTIERVVGRASLATETVGDIQEPMVEVRDESAEQLGFKLNELASGPVHHVREGTELNSFRQDKSGIRPYPKYKDSGMRWLGKVPEHWEIRRLKYLLKEHDVRSVVGHEQLLSVSQYTGVTQRELTGHGEEPETRAESLIGYRCVEPDDLVVNIMLAWNGSMGVSRFRGIVSPAYCVYRFGKNTHPRYFHHLLRSPAYKGRIKAGSTGVVESRLRLYSDDLCRIEALTPPFLEQTAIVRFLDHVDLCIERYIHAKQKLTTLLEEQKQAIIHRAVTGQINVRTSKPYPSYKTSGVEWLADVPMHWEIRRLRSLIIGRLTYGANAAAEHNNSTWPRYLRITDFTKNGKLRTDTFRSLPPDIAKDYLVEPGDVLLARSGATVGKAFLVDEHAGIACHAGYLIRVRLNRKLLNPSLFFAFTQSAGFERWKNSISIITTIQNISADKYSDLTVPVPPRSEQESILEFVRAKEESIDRAIHHVTEEIALIKELRTRLIADVVTGKLDIREAVTELPGETDERDPSDDVGDPHRGANV